MNALAETKTGEFDRRIHDFVPRAVMQSWFNDDYFIGAGSRSAYYELGTMLMLRGVYWYTVSGPQKANRSRSATATFSTNLEVAHAGCCYVDVEEDGIVFRGLRLYTNEKNKQTIKQCSHRPWRSIVAKLIPPSDPTAPPNRLALLFELCGEGEHQVSNIAKARKHLKVCEWDETAAKEWNDDEKFSESNDGWKKCFPVKVNNLADFNEEVAEERSRRASEARKLISRLLKAARHLEPLYPTGAPLHAAWLEISSNIKAEGTEPVMEGTYASMGNARQLKQAEPANGELHFWRLNPEDCFQ
jgi:hypothetical protein